MERSGSEMSAPFVRRDRVGADPSAGWFLLAIAALTGLRVLAAAILPLAFDESYYWLWAKHLAAGYFSHPPAVAWMIAAGTALFGRAVVGVRAGALLASVLATWMVWRAGAILLGSERRGGLAALFLNLTVMFTVQATVATPDAPALAAAAALLYALAKLQATVDGRWWLVVGLAAGFALLSKYTGLFLGVGIVLWLAGQPGRGWWRSPWLYAGGAVTFLLCAPNLWWNATHGWTTFRFDFGRIGVGAWSLHYIGEFFFVQLAFASPAILVLALWGLGRRGAPSLALVRAQVWPALAYFLVHALRDRVQGNWPSFLYPALCILAADRATRLSPGDWLRRAAVPLAIGELALVYAQALFGVLPPAVPALGVQDPLLRLLGYGVPDAAHQIGRLQNATRVRTIAVTDYGLAGWLAFYMDPDTTIIQLNDQRRWPDAPPGKATEMLWVTEQPNAPPPPPFGRISLAGTVARSRDGRVIKSYNVFRLDAPRSATVGRVVSP